MWLCYTAAVMSLFLSPKNHENDWICTEIFFFSYKNTLLLFGESIHHSSSGQYCCSKTVLLKSFLFFFLIFFFRSAKIFFFVTPNVEVGWLHLFYFSCSFLYFHLWLSAYVTDVSQRRLKTTPVMVCSILFLAEKPTLWKYFTEGCKQMLNIL